MVVAGCVFVDCSPKQQIPVAVGRSQDLCRQQYPEVLSASVTGSDSGMNWTRAMWLTPQRCATPDEWLRPAVAVQGYIVISEHLVRDSKTLRIPRVSSSSTYCFQGGWRQFPWHRLQKQLYRAGGCSTVYQLCFPTSLLSVEKSPIYPGQQTVLLFSFVFVQDWNISWSYFLSFLPQI